MYVSFWAHTHHSSTHKFLQANAFALPLTNVTLFILLVTFFHWAIVRCWQAARTHSDATRRQRPAVSQSLFFPFINWPKNICVWSSRVWNYKKNRAGARAHQRAFCNSITARWFFSGCSASARFELRQPGGWKMLARQLKFYFCPIELDNGPNLHVCAVLKHCLLYIYMQLQQNNYRRSNGH